MPGVVSDGPSVSLSFANNFWGKDDAGVSPLFERLANAKQTCDELKCFYSARAALEDEYARKLLSLSRKPLGSQEAGTLRSSLDIMRGEIEQMGKSHQIIAAQMKTELEEPLAAFAGAMKERRKIVQGGVEKLLKIKIQQTQHVNKTRDKFEQECLKIKGYLAQGHMVMGQEERKNKAKLEKAQINVATSNAEYEAAVKVLEETTGRWNRDWKAAADKFQDLEEERLDFMKSSLWSFANIASTVCVSDDASCEKVRLSLEKCEVEKDIISFIKERGTGQEIPDPPKYINFCRGDVNDTQSELSEDDSYSVAQFQRTINPAFRTSSPQPSVYESHHDPKSILARELGHHEPDTPPSRETTLTPQKAKVEKPRQTQPEYQRETNRLQYEQPQHDQRIAVPRNHYTNDVTKKEANRLQYQQSQLSKQASVPHDSYPSERTKKEPNRLQYEQPQNGQRTTVSHDSYPSESTKREPSRIQYQQSQHGKQTSVSHDSYASEGTKKEPNRLQYEHPQRSQRAAVISHNPYASEVAKKEPNRLQYEQSQYSKQESVSHDPHTMEGTKKQPRRLQYEQFQHGKQASISHDPHTIEETKKEPSRLQYEQSQHGPLAAVPHDPYPMDGMTMLCRTGPPSGRSSAHSGARPSSRDSQSEYSNPTSLSSQEPPSGKQSSMKQDIVLSPIGEKQMQKKKSGFFQSHSPFRRKSKHGKDTQSVSTTQANRNTWSSRTTTNNQNSPSRRSPIYGQSPRPNMITDRPNGSLEPVDPRASFQLNVGNNVFDVATPEMSKADQDSPSQNQEELDPIAQALAELKGVTKQSSVRVSADHYHGISTPAPGSASATRSAPPPLANGALMAGMRGTPPPSYDQPVQRLGLPQPAFTSKAMQQTSQKYVTQTQNIFSTPQRPESQGGYSSGSQNRPGTRGSDIPRATSPLRSVSPRPAMQAVARQSYRSVSPNPYTASQQRSYSQTSLQKRESDQTYYRRNSPIDVVRAISPAPFRDHSDRPSSSHTNSEMAIQLAPAPDDYGGSQRSRGGNRMPSTGGSARPISLYNGPPQHQTALRQRSKSVADGRQFSTDGRPLLNFARAMYMYQAAIPEELSFAKGDILAVIRLQDDGWWEAEVTGKNGTPGLVPSNYLQIIT